MAAKEEDAWWHFKGFWCLRDGWENFGEAGKGDRGGE